MTNVGAQEAQTHQSQHWVGGSKQETRCLCYAAVEQAIQRGFGGSVEQLEVAHNFMINPAGGGGRNEGVKYQTELATLISNDCVTGSEWSSVKGSITATMENILLTSWGDLPLTDRTFSAGKFIGDQVIKTIQGNGLVAIGYELHWKIIFGYYWSPENGYQLLVFDPWEGTESLVEWDVAVDGITMTYYVTG